ncbi:hypothetical protein Mapa_000715 [Marchantia paleacea]|nr:hypothetical protein Mapa_000715 [Marchantia paleacea]
MALAVRAAAGIGAGGNEPHPVVDLFLGLGDVFLAGVIGAAHYDEDGGLPLTQGQIRQECAVQQVVLGLPREVPHAQHQILVRNLADLDSSGALLGSIPLRARERLPVRPAQRFSQRGLADFGRTAQKHFGMVGGHIGLAPQQLQAAFPQPHVAPPEALGIIAHGLAGPSDLDGGI